MPEHVHEWRQVLGMPDNEVPFYCIHVCDERISWDEITRRLNAVERLSAYAGREFDEWIDFDDGSSETIGYRVELIVAEMFGKKSAAALEGE